jgi:LAO/AO transport system kinase
VKNFTDQELQTEIPKKNIRAISRLLTLIENNSAKARPVVKSLFQKTGKAHVIGITGSPGAGKSTLVDGLAVSLRSKGKAVAILAVDPSSPFSGGAILGDRIRMNKISEDGSVFIRSMATRGALGGLSRATIDAIQVLDAAGFDTIIIETVGVGQAEVDIVRVADSCVVVVVPGMGDSVQAIKAGIIEIADVFAVNKSDRDGAAHLVKDISVVLSLGEYPEGTWRPEIVSTIATTLSGIDDLTLMLDKHKSWLTSSSIGTDKKKNVLKQTLISLVGDIAMTRAKQVDSKMVDNLIEEILSKNIDPYTAAESILAKSTI